MLGRAVGADGLKATGVGTGDRLILGLRDLGASQPETAAERNVHLRPLGLVARRFVGRTAHEKSAWFHPEERERKVRNHVAFAGPWREIVGASGHGRHRGKQWNQQPTAR